MQQDKGGRSEEIMKQNQDRRLKPMQGENQQQQQQHQPQKCPRCDSLNTKFCYYNNYSLSQPRYFCKTCRRYWTQGGTLRNVPVGGGCRKGKRVKTSSSSTSSSSENSRSQSQPHSLSLGGSHNIMSSLNSGNSVNPALRIKESSGDLVLPPGISSAGPYYSGGGFLSSLAAIQSLNNQTPQPFALNQPVNLGGDLGVPSNLSLLHGFNAFGSPQQQQIQQQRQIYHMYNRENKSGDNPFYGNSSQSQQQQSWHQGFVSTTNPPESDTALWSISTSTTTGATNSSSTPTAGPFHLNAPSEHWHDLPGYGPPP